MNREYFRERINANKDKIPEHVLKVIEEELTKLQRLEASLSDIDEISNYLDWLTVLPWGNFSEENFDVVRAEKILDEEHYGLYDVKERILEFIAVGRLRGTSQGKIICLSGPPGVGKTSIVRSIARALDRKFFRFSVGGLSDVDEIKGIRRSYSGALPGKMVQCLKSVGTSNPLVLIDEIDKIVSGRSGDPASALLEVMDPEQNANFLDHYLDVTIDLSKVLFVCTANVINTISKPLLDRMEVITIAGYITDEKMHIARDHLVKTTCRDCGIKPEQVVLSDAALLSLIENYCREAGVRNLQKCIDKIYRKIALKLVRQGASTEDTKSSAKTDLQSSETSAEGYSKESPETKTEQSGAVAETVVKLMIDQSNLVDYVGKPKFRAEKIYEQTPVGVVMGLAWTSMGGSTLYIETTFIEEGEGEGGLHVTGQLGDVMKESAEIAHTVARRIMLEKEPKNLFFRNSKLHLHVPAGATPKDGPSAGCTMITSLLSLAMKKPVRKDLAMTGEVTLTGRILPIGGVKEKTIAARRSQVKMIIFPEANRRDFEELAENVKEGLDVHFVDEYEQIFELAFVNDQVEINKIPMQETDDESSFSEKIREMIEPIKEKIPKHVLKVIEEELTKLEIEASSSDCSGTYNYLDWLTVLPWGNFSNENFDVLRAEKILDEEHYGLSDVKERILEFIAVGRLRGTSQGKIICLSGPPGVGKTSIARSIARALDRKFFRFSVGGLTDVDEIKGIRRSYNGALPGKMVQCLKSVGTSNPLVLIDEIDKIVSGRSGNPASALLEVMDPEQNANFLDIYLNVTIDLSKVLFVCTANRIDMIPKPLLDRMEVIDIKGYITDEKMHIARDYLVKTTCRDCGIKPEQVVLSDAALLSLIENYCREAGVRNLQKCIDKIYRKIALKLVRQGASTEDTKSSAKTDLQSSETSAEGYTEESPETKTEQSGAVAETVVKLMIDESNLADYVGKPKFHGVKIYGQTPVGVVMGLAWTSMGGTILYIETTFVEEGEGKGGLHVTGQLGNVMKESAEIAHTVARRIMLKKEPENRFFANSKLHLHVPEGGTSKDGPSAGCTMITSLLSLAMRKPVRNDLAMTGEVTLTGRILSIGGVREKTIAARRCHVKMIIFPEANRRDFDELPENVKEGLDVHFVYKYEQIFKLAFGYHLESPLLNIRRNLTNLSLGIFYGVVFTNILKSLG